MDLKLNDKEPIYIQIIKFIKIQIVKGELKPGDVILSRREMAISINVNPNTVQKAYKEMESMRIIYTIKNQPSTITTDIEKISSIRKELINESLQNFIEDMKLIDVKKEEIIKIIDEIY